MVDQQPLVIACVEEEEELGKGILQPLTFSSSAKNVSLVVLDGELSKTFCGIKIARNAPEIIYILVEKLDWYSTVSRQVINTSKSDIFFSVQTQSLI